jgi:hypothetical protein
VSSYKTCFNINSNFIRIKYKYHYFDRMGGRRDGGMGGWVGLRNGWMGGRKDGYKEWVDGWVSELDMRNGYKGGVRF